MCFIEEMVLCDSLVNYNRPSKLKFLLYSGTTFMWPKFKDELNWSIDTKVSGTESE